MQSSPEPEPKIQILNYIVLCNKCVHVSSIFYPWETTEHLH